MKLKEIINMELNKPNIVDFESLRVWWHIHDRCRNIIFNSLLYKNSLEVTLKFESYIIFTKRVFVRKGTHVIRMFILSINVNKMKRSAYIVFFLIFGMLVQHIQNIDLLIYILQ